jgi:hypothetical protein
VGQPWIAPDSPAEPRPTPPQPAVAPTAPDPVATSTGRPLRDAPVARLAPRTITSILDGGFEVLRYRFTTIATVSLVLVLPLVAVPAIVSVLGVLDRLDDTTSVPAASLGIGFTSNSRTGLVVVSMLTSSLALALVGVAVGHVVSSWLTGGDPTAADALRFVGRRGLVTLVAWFVALVLKVTSTAICGVGLLLVVPMFVVLSPVVAVEGLGPLASIGRSWRLSTRRRAGTMILLVIASFLLTLAFQLILGAIAGVIQSQVIGDAPWGWIVLGVLSVACQLFVVPLQSCWAALAYLDLRVRSEGVDLELEAADVFDRAR